MDVLWVVAPAREDSLSQVQILCGFFDSDIEDHCK